MRFERHFGAIFRGFLGVFWGPGWLDGLDGLALGQSQVDQAGWMDWMDWMDWPLGSLRWLLAGKTRDPLPTGFKDFGAILGAVLKRILVDLKRFWLNCRGLIGFGAILKEFWCNFRGFLGFFGVLKGLLAGKTRDPLPTGFRDFGAILGDVL